MRFLRLSSLVAYLRSSERLVQRRRVIAASLEEMVSIAFFIFCIVLSSISCCNILISVSIRLIILELCIPVQI